MTRLRSFPFWTALVFAVTAAAASVTCVSENTQDCGNGLVCPEGTRCASEQNVCIRDECGDGEEDPGEACDDGNITDGDGCSATCESTEECGNGILDDAPEMGEDAEVCDPAPGNMTPGDGCSADCMSTETCGNGVHDTAGLVDPEACDDGNSDNDDGCQNDCDSDNSCGNNITDSNVGEACDDGGAPGGCNDDCQGGVDCHDGVLDPGEECDDGDTVQTNGCVDFDTNGDGDVEDSTDLCRTARCGDGHVRADGSIFDEECDTRGDTQDCNVDCTLPECGDGYVNDSFVPPDQTGDPNPFQLEEQCDEGVPGADSAECTHYCTLSFCGDGYFNDADPAEECDDAGNSVDCNADCTVSECGDGFKNTADGEQCDDDNTTPGDGCSATCQIEPFALSVSKTGTGTGTVTSAPSGINCGSDCTEIYAQNTVVTLTAAVGTNSVFTGWSGAGCTGTGTCVVTMDAAKTVTATFDLNVLTVTRSGNGSGTVTSVPTGIDCGSDCTEPFPNNTAVTLTAAPASNSSFTGWSGGGCTGTGSCVTTMTGATTVTATFTLNVHTLTVAKAGNGSGTVSSTPSGIDCGSDCTGDYNAGTVVTLSAVASSNSTFTGWSGGGCTGTAPCNVTVNAAVTVTATFTLNVHQLSVSRAGNGAGTVTSSPAGINCGSDCAEGYDAGTVVTLTAVATTGSVFGGWSGSGCTGTGTCVVTVNAAASVTATFTLAQHILTVTKSGTGDGTVSSVPSGIDCGSDCTQGYDTGTLVTLTPVPVSNSAFTGWSNACTGLLTCTVTMDQARTVNAQFDTDTRTVTVSKAGNGTGTVTSSPVGVNCGATCAAPFAKDSTVTLTAVAAGDSAFTGWSGSGCTGTATCELTMSNNRSVTATFALNQFTLGVTVSGTGTVTSFPSGISCPGDCSQVYDSGTDVVLVAAAASGWTFTGWTGGGCTGTGACSTTVTAATNVTATFTQNQYTLTVVKTGNGVGTVTSNVAGINCGGDCSELYNSGQSIILTAAASSNVQFNGWSGGGCSGTGTCTVSMDAAKTVSADFTVVKRTLTVATSGTGTGSVASIPAGVSCPGDCTEQYDHGTVVVLTPTPGANSTFTGWSGDCTGTGQCFVTMSAARNVTAQFTLDTWTLDVSKTGPGSGTITSAPAGISCGATCSAIFNAPTSVTLTAAAATGSTFTGWSGEGCSGTGTCVVSMTAARSVTASFELEQTLTVLKTGGGTGTVTSSPAGINCGATCDFDYEFGTSVTLTAAPSTGMVFMGWAGDCTGPGACVVTMDQARSVDAVFEPE